MGRATHQIHSAEALMLRSMRINQNQTLHPPQEAKGKEVSISNFQYLQMLARSPKLRQPKPENPVKREGDLHDQIINWCDSQWPRVKYIHARMDRRSTIAVGAADFILFLSMGRVLCAECKTKTGKLSAEQSAWAKEMEMLGHAVHVVRSFEEFLTAVKPK